MAHIAQMSTAGLEPGVKVQLVEAQYIRIGFI